MLKGLPFNSASDVCEVIRCASNRPNFKCARTKIAAIIKAVLCRKAYESMQDDMKKASTVAIHIDSTTLHNTKIFVILAKYFLPLEGIQVRCLDVRNIEEETAAKIVSYILDAVDNAGIDRAKVKILCADNMNTNFGGPTQQGFQNVANLLEQTLGHGIFRCGCLAHIENNTFRKVCTVLFQKRIFKLSSALKRLYNYFNQQIRPREALRRHWIRAGNHPNDLPYLRKYGETRWLSAEYSIQNMRRMWQVLNSYFTEKWNEERTKPRPSEEVRKLFEF